MESYFLNEKRDGNDQLLKCMMLKDKLMSFIDLILKTCLFPFSNVWRLELSSAPVVPSGDAFTKRSRERPETTRRKRRKTFPKKVLGHWALETIVNFFVHLKARQDKMC